MRTADRLIAIAITLTIAFAIFCLIMALITPDP